MKEFKVCMLGSGSVGKSALAIQFTENRFVESYDPTVEDCYRKEIDVSSKEKGIIEIIDTAGTEQFTSMVELYIRNCQGFILVYDVTKKSSFDNLEALKDLVLKTKKCTAKNAPPMVVVGNKIDDPDREVLMGLGLTKAKEWGAIFLETSAKTNAGVDECFKKLLEQLMKKEKGNGCCVIS
eukprot:m.151275 g.151275  ORF g.151275 m.151275 type:complete len:181 (-) comp15037_c1_seq4:117-659(-)